jgi:hypothetical protein
VLYFNVADHLSYLWYNPIGCAACVLFSILFQAVIGERPRTVGGPATT